MPLTMPIQTNASAAVVEEYESYTETSKVYDQRRKAIGVNYISDAIRQVMQRTGRTKEGIRLLDAGCGTGNYITQVADMVGQAVGFDYNDGMLEQCRSSAKDKQMSLSTRVTFPSCPLRTTA